MPRHNGYAQLSACGTYRYELGGHLGTAERHLAPSPVQQLRLLELRDRPLVAPSTQPRMILWIMLNPSTADATKDDQTIRAIATFSELWGYNRLMVGNLYAFRATDPDDMWCAQRKGIDIVGPDNDAALMGMIDRARSTNGEVMAAWGGKAKRDRVQQVAALAGPLKCLRTNKDGSPVHPLYQPHYLMPTTWQVPA